MRAFKRTNVRGFTLVELMIVVAIIGVLAALAIYGVTRYLASAKTSEAKNAIGSISRGAQGAYEKEQAAAELLTAGAAGNIFSHDVCETSSYSIGPVPNGKKIAPDPATFSTPQAGNSTNVGWTCLRFSITDPTYYRYGYTAARVNTTLPAGEVKGGAAAPTKLTANIPMPAIGFLAFAEGDLNNDTKLSAFGSYGAVDTQNQVVTISTQLTVVDELE